MRDRLIAMLRQADFDYGEECVCAAEDGYKGAIDFAEYFADFLLANGVIVPSLKVGDTVYYTHRGKIWSAKVYYIDVVLMEDYVSISAAEAANERGAGIEFNWDSIGKTVFLTEEEAEQALKGGAK